MDNPYATPGQRDELAGTHSKWPSWRGQLPAVRFHGRPLPKSVGRLMLFELFETRPSHDALTALEQTSRMARRTMTLLARPPDPRTRSPVLTWDSRWPARRHRSAGRRMNL